MPGIKAITLIFLSSLLSMGLRTPARAQYPALLPSYSHDLLGSKQESGIDCIRNIFQDSRGRLWFQTCGDAEVNGIRQVQYDGYRFHFLHNKNKQNFDQYNLTVTGINDADQLFGIYNNHQMEEMGGFFLDPITEELILHKVTFPGITKEANALNMTKVSDNIYQILSSDKGSLHVHQVFDGKIEEMGTVNDPDILSRLRGWSSALLENLPSGTWFMGISLPLIRYDQKSKELRKYIQSDFDLPPDIDYLQNFKFSTHPSRMVESPTGDQYLYLGYRMYILDQTNDQFRSMEKEFPVGWRGVGLYQDDQGNICFVFRDESETYRAILQTIEGIRYDYSAFFQGIPPASLTNVIS
ncbi:MAG: hypothetical protein KDD99_32415, partial [Bacteroidetes bacterium]|nr:hypothetical protein [Bacteroidota bacterium]